MRHIPFFILAAPTQFLLVLLGYILAPFLAVYSVLSGRKTLPGLLQWFSTADDDLDGGQHQLGWRPVTGFGLWLQRTRWIYRNTAQGFATYWFGIPRVGTQVKVLESTKPIWEGQKGFRYRATLVTPDGKEYFCYRTNWLWIGWNPWGPRPDRCMMKVSPRLKWVKALRRS